MAEINDAKARLLYDVIDERPDVFEGHAEPASRSRMNVTFRLARADDEAAFLAGAAEERMVELRGHRSVGGVRASIYNAMPVEGVERLAAYMRRFAER
jgi:phosphoserine aminotransferase